MADETKAPEPADTVTLKAPKGTTEVSVNGATFEVSKGVVIVPSSAVATLLAFGFSE